MSENRVLSKLGDVAEDFAEVLAHWSEIVTRFLTGRWAKAALVVVAFVALLRVLGRSMFGYGTKAFGVLLALTMVWNAYAYVRINSDECRKTGSIYGAATFECKDAPRPSGEVDHDALKRMYEREFALLAQDGLDLESFCVAIDNSPKYEVDNGERYREDTAEQGCARVGGSFNSELLSSWIVDRMKEVSR